MKDDGIFRDARGCPVARGALVLITPTYATAMRMHKPVIAEFSHWDETLQKAFYVNPDTNRLNRCDREVLFKLPVD